MSAAIGRTRLGIAEGSVPAGAQASRTSLRARRAAREAFETDVTERVLEAFAQHGVLPPAILHRSLDTAIATPRA